MVRVLGKVPCKGATYEAYYDTTLDIMWLANPLAAGIVTTAWAIADSLTAALNIYGIGGWRMPTARPVNGMNFSLSQNTDGSTDGGTAATTTDGTDGGWRDNAGQPVSELGHMYYVTLGNLGRCDPTLPWCTTQPGSGLGNTGPFSNLQSVYYWTDVNLSTSTVMSFSLGNGNQTTWRKDFSLPTWVVRDGDISAVPVPAAVWLFGSGLLGLIGIATRKKA